MAPNFLKGVGFYERLRKLGKFVEFWGVKLRFIGLRHSYYGGVLGECTIAQGEKWDEYILLQFTK